MLSWFFNAQCNSITKTTRYFRLTKFSSLAVPDAKMITSGAPSGKIFLKWQDFCFNNPCMQLIHHTSVSLHRTPVSQTGLLCTQEKHLDINWRNWYRVWGHGCDTTDSQMSPQPRRSRGCGDIWESVVSQPWPKTRYQFLFYHGTTKFTLN